MPAITMGTQLAMFFQFIVFMGVLGPVLSFHTIPTGGIGPGFGIVGIYGYYIPPINQITGTGEWIPLNSSYLIHFNRTVNAITNNFSTAPGTTGFSAHNTSLAIQLRNQANATAATYNSSASILTTVGGYAFIPSAIGSFIHSILNMPQNALTIISTLFSNTGSYVVIPISMMLLISGAIFSYVIITDVLIIFGIITKTSPQEI
jgi:hypothetical protein